MQKLEEALFDADGYVSKTNDMLQAIEDRNVGKAVTVGGVM